MAATFWTLTYAGTENSFAGWGFDEETAESTVSNMETDLFTIAIAGATVDSDPIFPFEALVTIRGGRTFSGGVYSGGWIEFQGKRLLHVLDGRPEYEGVVYQFGGPWYDLDQTPYQQTVYYWTGPGTTTASYLVSALVLFQKVTGAGTTAVRNNGQQVQDILQHLLDQYTAQSMAAPYQIGTIDPASNVMTYQVKDIKCSEAIRLCLRVSPDATVYFDYSTVPPTVNVRKRANLAGANVAFADGVQHESLKLSPRYDLQARSVVLYFDSHNTINGSTFVQTTKQKYPLAGPDGGLRVLVQTIDLAGWSTSFVAGSLSVTAVANTLTWWKKYIPELASSNITGFSVGAMTILDETGTPISLATYPNVLDDGSSIANWMQLVGGTPVTGVRATITVIAAYNQNDSSGRTIVKFPKKELVARVTLTNGVTGNYSSETAAVEGEAVPANLAQDIYNSLSTLQYEGSITLVQNEISGVPSMANVLNLTGGRAEWTTINALIQQIRKQYGKGRTEIVAGPARHLSAADLTQLFLINRFRWVRYNPTSQATGQLGNSLNVQLGTNAPKENTLTGLDEPSLLVLSTGGSTATQIQHDSPNGQIVMGVFDHTGTLVAGNSSAAAKLGDLSPDGTARAVGFRFIYFKDAKNSCASMKMMVWGTAPEPDV